ncbi:recombination protein RecR [Candidatus Shapirobacteria bacterium]|nr:recombination protein RecR [Candidatus Shapirobacteria bacterium]
MAGLPKAINDLTNCFARLPGIGPKSATRLAFYLVNTPRDFVEEMAKTFLRVKTEVKICRQCFSVSDEEMCDICSDKKRNQNVICVVERAIDVVALEKVGGFAGVYHVLGGVLNPLDHVGPEELKISELILRITNYELLITNEKEKQVEIILALNLTMEGEATALYIKKKIESNFQKTNSQVPIKITRIGSGLPIGADLEFADQVTLSRAMEGRREI